MKPDFSEIKHLYVWFESEIFKSFKQTGNISKWVDPYCLGFNFIEIFTPIERITWDALRYFGKAPFYPQYPVGKYFLDFGNPLIKVGIECDGKEFHQDKEKDLNRDTDLHRLGWDIYRISGSDCNKDIPDFNYWENYDSDQYVDNYRFHIPETVEGLIKALSVVYFKQHIPGDVDNIINAVCSCLRNRVSLYSLDYEKKLRDSINNLYGRNYTQPFEM